MDIVRVNCSFSSINPRLHSMLEEHVEYDEPILYCMEKENDRGDYFAALVLGKSQLHFAYSNAEGGGYIQNTYYDIITEVNVTTTSRGKFKLGIGPAYVDGSITIDFTTPGQAEAVASIIKKLAKI